MDQSSQPNKATTLPNTLTRAHTGPVTSLTSPIKAFRLEKLNSNTPDGAKPRGNSRLDQSNTKSNQNDKNNGDVELGSSIKPSSRCPTPYRYTHSAFAVHGRAPLPDSGLQFEDRKARMILYRRRIMLLSTVHI